ncbi:hypothetical protein OH76DRAFT_514856 [Lentinus brumalis]|uniref:Uncharacterized protein n=1 Tax=Lentinus brumalis TaxID=2498619 RepID=A0A371DBA7_9APHY|nr:hypothetical protein OH76DRAFT_514856 [Polyporus brumalis]
MLQLHCCRHNWKRVRDRRAALSASPLTSLMTDYADSHPRGPTASHRMRDSRTPSRPTIDLRRGFESVAASYLHIGPRLVIVCRVSWRDTVPRAMHEVWSIMHHASMHSGTGPGLRRHRTPRNHRLELQRSTRPLRHLCAASNSRLHPVYGLALGTRPGRRLNSARVLRHTGTSCRDLAGAGKYVRGSMQGELTYALAFRRPSQVCATLLCPVSLSTSEQSGMH